MTPFDPRIDALIAHAARALELEVPYRVRPPEREGTPAAVMLALAVGTRDEGEEPFILLTRRTQTVDTHKGQYAFPGGVMDPEDVQERGLVTTALREFEEEMGIPRSFIHPIGCLPRIWTPSGFNITPVIGVLLKDRHELEVKVSAAEVEHFFWTRVSDFRQPGVHSVEFRRLGEVEYPVEVYQLGEHRIWGATGAMLKNFLDRLEKLS